MEMCTTGICPFSSINWLWYAVAVVVTYGFGMFWYGSLFSKQWVKAIGYQCKCGADLSKGEQCTCKSNSPLPFIMQFVVTAGVGLMYFILVGLSFWYAIIVVIAISGWMKSTLKFKTADWKKYLTVVSIEVGYFFLTSVIFILFALI